MNNCPDCRYITTCNQKLIQEITELKELVKHTKYMLCEKKLGHSDVIMGLLWDYEVNYGELNDK